MRDQIAALGTLNKARPTGKVSQSVKREQLFQSDELIDVAVSAKLIDITSNGVFLKPVDRPRVEHVMKFDLSANTMQQCRIKIEQDWQEAAYKAIVGRESPQQKTLAQGSFRPRAVESSECREVSEQATEQSAAKGL